MIILDMKTIKKKSTKYYKKKNIEKSTSKNTKKDLNFIEKKKKLNKIERKIFFTENQKLIYKKINYLNQVEKEKRM